MDRHIIAEKLDGTPIEKRNLEIVERKGLGHPDSVADGLAEAVSRALCKEYIKRFGHILHHNTDETQIVAGQSAPKFGGGTIIQPVRIILVGRATSQVGTEDVPVGSTAIAAAREYLRKTFPNLNIDSHVTITCYIGTGSLDLRKLFESTGIPKANDTSFGVGYAPLSETELITLDSEKYINSTLKKELPELGEDVKVMANRLGKKINLTVAVATVDSKVDDIDHYVNVIEEVKNKITDNALRYTEREVNVSVNTADNVKRGIIYLTVTGLSMENGDDGSVGRGNRVNGLITPFRPMSLEASAGKNPVTHVGKIYNILSKFIANDIVKDSGGDVEEVHVRICSQIGRYITHPQHASAQMMFSRNVNEKRHMKNAEGIIENWLDNIEKIKDMILNDEIAVF